ncbi:hypothetical protein [Agarivorans litoreus]|uniref:hypothetical protein n=1 Tax=Agarivorans litoreus TaxID=1510455 RepID=UPI001C7D84A7|nr:hypothetical protein [Agarivorans litoreus]
MNSVPESDWKLFRKLQPELVDKVCEAVFLKVDALSKSRAGSQHHAYLKLFSLIQDEDLLIAKMFNDPKRSNVMFKIIELRRNDILSDEQFAQFSKDTQNRVTTTLR